MTSKLTFLVSILLFSLPMAAQKRCVAVETSTISALPSVEKQEVLQVLKSGDWVELIKPVDTAWALVKTGETTGYLLLAHLAETCPAAAAEPPAATVKKVLICGGLYSYAYHKRLCEGLKKCGESPKSMALDKALENGFKPCGYCYQGGAGE